MKIAILCFAAVLLPLVATAFPQQRGPKPLTSRQVRLNPKDPHVFVRLLREGEIAGPNQKETDNRVWLRIHNNSIWTVMFCSEPTSEDYGDLAVTYKIERYSGRGEVPGTGSSDACSYFLLESNKFITFSVPRKHLAEGLAVAIPYKYEWEVNPEGSDNALEPKHFAFFYSSDLRSSTK